MGSSISCRYLFNGILLTFRRNATTLGVSDTRSNAVNLAFLLAAIAAIVIHEGSHVLAAVALGVKVKRVGLSWRGPYIVREPGTPAQCIAIAMAGPLANSLTAVVCLVVGHGVDLCTASLVLGAFNLLPIPSSDGLRAARLWWGHDSEEFSAPCPRRCITKAA
jgi:Zn-dependent protease